jgi:acylphosphatase
MTDEIAIRATIRGEVQGVNYRAWTKEEAERRGLAGWVRNMPDGTVLAQFAGPRDKVDDMLAACREGPRDARVSSIETERVDPPPAIQGFRINR